MSETDPSWAEDGLRLAAAIAASGLDKQDVAREVGRTRQQLTRYLKGGQAVPPHLRPEFARVLHVMEHDIWVAHVPSTRRAESEDIGPFVFGRNVRARRVKLDLKSSVVARAIGLHTGEALEQLEAGKSNRKDRAELAPKLAAILRTKVPTLMRDAAPPAKRGSPTERYSADLFWEIARDLRRIADRAETHGKDLLRNAAVPDAESK